MKLDSKEFGMKKMLIHYYDLYLSIRLFIAHFYIIYLLYMLLTPYYRRQNNIIYCRIVKVLTSLLIT